jgi:hypothetical protein
MSLIRRMLTGPSGTRGIQPLGGEVYAPEGSGTPQEPTTPEGKGAAPEAEGAAPEAEAGAPEAADRPATVLGTIGTQRLGGVLGVSGIARGGISATGALGSQLIGQTAPALPTVTSTPGTVFVEVGTAAEQAAISRNGVQIPIVQINPATLQTALGNTAPLPARVVSQSIAPGISVAKGTTVDITLTEPTRITVGVLQNPFQPLAGQTLDAVYKSFIRDNPAVQSVLARNSGAASLSQVDQSTLTQALANSPVTATPGQTIDAAFDTLQAAFTFGS